MNRWLIALFIFFLPACATADYDQGNHGNVNGSATITGSTQNIVYLTGTNTPGTDLVKTFRYDPATGILYVDSVITKATNVPQTNYIPSTPGDTAWGIGENADANGSSNDSLFFFEGTDVTASHRMSIAPGGVVTIPSLIATSQGASTFTGDLTLSTHNLITDTSTGTKFGTATSQKFGFFNATPIVQPTGNVCTAMQNLGLVASCTESGGGSGTITSSTSGQIPVFTGATTIAGSTYLTSNGITTAIGNPNSTYIDAVSGENNIAINGVGNNLNLINNQADDTTGGAGLNLFQDSGAATTSGSRIGVIRSYAMTDNTHRTGANIGATIGFFASQNWTGSATGTEIHFETVTNGATSRANRLTIGNSGNLQTSGTLPTVSSCGTSPSMTALSNNNSGSVQVGSVSATSCIITFANGGWDNAPNCVANDDTSIIAVKTVSTTTTLTLSSTVLTGDKITYICQGNK